MNNKPTFTPTTTERDTSHQCCCMRLIQTEDKVVEDQCGVWVESGDDPFCRDCEDRHPEYDSSIIIKVAAILNGRIVRNV